MPSHARNIVVALCGPPGAGKTTLIREIRRTTDVAAVIFYDDHQTVTQRTQADIDAWLGRGADPNEFELPSLVAALDRARDAEAERGIVLFETPFGRHHRETGALIDLLIWLDMPLDIAFARQVKAFCAAALQRRRSEDAAFIGWLETYAAIYLTSTRAAYQLQTAMIRAGADAIVDATADPAHASRRIVELARTMMAAHRG